MAALKGVSVANQITSHLSTIDHNRDHLLVSWAELAACWGTGILEVTRGPVDGRHLEDS